MIHMPYSAPKNGSKIILKIATFILFTNEYRRIDTDSGHSEGTGE